MTDPPRAQLTTPETSQSPAVKEMLPMFVPAPLVTATPEANGITFSTYSPPLPACALLLVFVPTIPAV